MKVYSVLLLTGLTVLALGIATPLSAGAQTSAPPQATTPAIVHPKIEHVEYTSFADLIKKLPDAKPVVEQYGSNPQKPADAILKSRGFFAQIKDKLFIYQSTAPVDCGLRGCDTVIFSLDENGFYPSGSVLTAMFPPEYDIDQYGEPSVFTCTVDLEWIEWKRRDSMEMTGEPVAGENCERFMSVYNESTP